MCKIFTKQKVQLLIISNESTLRWSSINAQSHYRASTESLSESLWFVSSAKFMCLYFFILLKLNINLALKYEIIVQISRLYVNQNPKESHCLLIKKLKLLIQGRAKLES